MMLPLKIPLDFSLSSEEIRHLRHTQLALLTRIDASNFPRWDSGKHLSERTLERLAQGLYASKLEVLKGFEFRRQDSAIARAAQAKADRLIAFLHLEQESA